MSLSFAGSAPARHSDPGAAQKVVVAVVSTVGVLAFLLVGITFFALAIAFPIAVPVARAAGVPVSPHDLELATRFADLAWAFVALSVASFGAAIAVAVAATRRLSPVDPD
jgi:hypothetical protein